MEVKGVGKDEPIVTNDKGGMQSKTPYGFHLCDPRALLKMAEVMQYGASRYKRDNWKNIDPEDHYNHLMMHLTAWYAGDTQDDHLGHGLARMMMLWVTAQGEK